MKQIWIAVALLLLAPVFVAAEEPAVATDASETAVNEPLELLFEEPSRSPVESPAEPPVSEEGELFMAFEISACTHPQPSSVDCDSWDSSYCDYEWDCECCCVAVWVASGAHCPNYCI